MQPRWPLVRPARAFVPPLPPPRGFLGHLVPPRGLFPRFIPPPCPPPPRRPVDTDQLWLDTFKRTYCHLEDRSKSIANACREPPLRLLRRRITQTQKLVEQLKAVTTDLAAVENKMKTLSTASGGDVMHHVEASRLRVQQERKLAVCKMLKQQLEAMNATSGLFPKQQLTEIQHFARRVNKKKAYRKRAKLRRRADASIRRALDSKMREDVESTDKVEVKIVEDDQILEEKIDASPVECSAHTQLTATYLSTTECRSSKQSLDPETLTIDALIAVRRAWDAFIVFPQTPGASTIPSHFVPPPPAPSIQWAVYVASSARS